MMTSSATQEISFTFHTKVYFSMDLEDDCKPTHNKNKYIRKKTKHPDNYMKGQKISS